MQPSVEVVRFPGNPVLRFRAPSQWLRPGPPGMLRSACYPCQFEPKLWRWQRQCLAAVPPAPGIPIRLPSGDSSGLRRAGRPFPSRVPFGVGPHSGMLSRNTAYPQVSILPLPLRTEVPGSAEPCLAAFPPAPGIPMKPPNLGRPSGLRRAAESFPLAGPVRRRASSRKCSAGTLRILRSAYYPCLFELESSRLGRAVPGRHSLQHQASR
jgi:hypothetical protein